MKLNHRLTRIFFGLTVSALSFWLFIAPVSVGAVSSAAQGVEISPTIVELNASRGKTYIINLKIGNITASDLVYNVSVDDFGATDETGSPHILINSNLPSTSSIKSWVSSVSKFTLASQKSKQFDAQISIPSDAEPGGHYGVLTFSGIAPEVKSTGVGLSASAGVLILIRVDGDITEKADLVSFYGSQNGKQNSFFENGPITLVTRVQNKGNIHIKPSGSIEIRDMFGNMVSKLDVNVDKSNVLPDSIRRFESEYKEKWMFGRYTANLALGYGTTGQAITATVIFWVIPYKIILSILLVVATILYIFSRLIKVYNKRIITKYKNEDSSKDKKTNKKG